MVNSVVNSEGEFLYRRLDCLMRASLFCASQLPAARLLPAPVSFAPSQANRLSRKRVEPRSYAVINELPSLSSAWETAIERTLTVTAENIPALTEMLDRGEQHALLLSTLAGLSTSIGGAIAIVKKPGNDLLSFLLGVAIGVMATLSVLEMWLHNAAEHGPAAITAATAAGVALYYAAQPYFPDFEQHEASIWSAEPCKLGCK